MVDDRQIEVLQLLNAAACHCHGRASGAHADRLLAPILPPASAPGIATIHPRAICAPDEECFRVAVTGLFSGADVSEAKSVFQEPRDDRIHLAGELGRTGPEPMGSPRSVARPVDGARPCDGREPCHWPRLASRVVDADFDSTPCAGVGRTLPTIHQVLVVTVSTTRTPPAANGAPCSFSPPLA